ncbi:MAG: secondary thiamine-phosphate synthase enzyme YjbQ [Candidatus Ranarchaeia archaeon]|jgi:secondary thiamine-phosphate synthase enzyme
MTVETTTFSVKTQGEVQVIDITSDVQKIVSKSKIENGLVVVFVSGSTAGITTLEYEPGLVFDLPAALERLFPKGIRYKHEETWHDGNGHSHIRASFLRQSYTIPVVDRQLTLGTWQQVVFVELDVKPRTRKVIVQIVGD